MLEMCAFVASFVEKYEFHLSIGFVLSHLRIVVDWHMLLSEPASLNSIVACTDRVQSRQLCTAPPYLEKAGPLNEEPWPSTLDIRR